MRALIVSYAFPPTGGAGVARPLKLAKFLPEFGVTPAVLTAANPSVPLRDEGLLADIDPTLEIVRARTLEPGYAVKAAAWSADASAETGLRARLRRRLVGLAKSMLVPDAQILWQPAAAAALARRRDDVVWITAPPFSSFLLAPVARARGAAVVLDYRDEWKTLRETYEMSSPWSAWAGSAMEKRLVALADAITCATPAFREALLAEHPRLEGDRVHVVTNGFDPDDYPAPLPEPPSDSFTVTYAGTILTVTAPGGFLAAVRLLREREPALAARLRVRFIGRVVATEEHHFADAAEIGVERTGYMSKDEVVRELAASHLNLCLLSDHDDCRRIYPGKIFELMAIGRPVMTIAPRGALSDLVAEHKVGVCFAPTDASGIAADLEARLRRFIAGDYVTRDTGIDLERFHRRALAGRVAAVLRSAVDARARRSGS